MKLLHDRSVLHYPLEPDSYLNISGWKTVGSASLYQDTDEPLEALKRSLEIIIPANNRHIVGERAGVNNTGKSCSRSK